MSRTSRRSLNPRFIESGLGLSRCRSLVPTARAGALRSGLMTAAGCPGRARWKAASLVVRPIRSSAGRCRRQAAPADAGPVARRRAARWPRSPTNTGRQLATALRRNPVTQPATGTDLGSSIRRDGTIGREVTDTRQDPVTARLATDQRPDMVKGQAPATAALVAMRPKLATALAPTTVLVLAMALVQVMAAEPATGRRQ